jgi:hypothetical protein
MLDDCSTRQFVKSPVDSPSLTFRKRYQTDNHLMRPNNIFQTEMNLVIQSYNDNHTTVDKEQLLTKKFATFLQRQLTVN